MATIINNPPSDNSSMNMVVGLIVLVVVGYLAYVYGLPAIQKTMQSGAPQINVPSKIDINVNQTK